MEFKISAGNFKIPVLGIGTWGMGGFFDKDTSRDREETLAIKTAVKLGMTHIDTAEIYGKGHTEELVGEAIKEFNRKDLFITSKVWSDNLGYDNLISAARGSLKRMGTDYIDLYLIHWPNPEFPLKETMRAMDFLVEQGLVRFIGLSNFSLELLKEAQSCSRNRIVANQVEYSLLKREPERELLPYCLENDVMLVAYTPLARGRLAKPGFKVLDDLAEKYKKTQAQIAINWLISQKNVITIPKATSIGHLKENLGSIGWSLGKGDIEMLDKEFRAPNP